MLTESNSCAEFIFARSVGKKLLLNLFSARTVLEMDSRTTREVRRMACRWRSNSALRVGLLTVCTALSSVGALSIAAWHPPEPLQRLQRFDWKGPPPAAGSRVVPAPGGTPNYYLSRGPVVYLIETDAGVVSRAWIWRLEDAESLRERWAPSVGRERVIVSDLQGDVAEFDRRTGRARWLPTARHSPALPEALGYRL